MSDQQPLGRGSCSPRNSGESGRSGRSVSVEHGGAIAWGEGSRVFGPYHNSDELVPSLTAGTTSLDDNIRRIFETFTANSRPQVRA